jgi:ADP-ribose pyrophosphatase YjhB (NUDIX family)
VGPSPGAIPPVVKALIRRDQHLLLVEEQGPDDPVRSWMLPGGRVEPGESQASALRREIREETGLRLTGTPTLAFSLEIELALDAVGIWRVATYACDAEGTVEPSDVSILSAGGLPWTLPCAVSTRLSGTTRPRSARFSLVPLHTAAGTPIASAGGPEPSFGRRRR